MRQTTHSAEETQSLAKAWMKTHPNHKIWLLKGDLGAGKTNFVKGVAEHFGEDPLRVKSPTFALIEEHPGWIHADLYRLDAPDLHLEEELKEYMKTGHSLFIEWPERLDALKNLPHAEVVFTHKGGDEREIELILLP